MPYLYRLGGFGGQIVQIAQEMQEICPKTGQFGVKIVRFVYFLSHI
jgi:hypothetical protein